MTFNPEDLELSDLLYGYRELSQVNKEILDAVDRAYKALEDENEPWNNAVNCAIILHDDILFKYHENYGSLREED